MREMENLLGGLGRPLVGWWRLCFHWETLKRVGLVSADWWDCPGQGAPGGEETQVHKRLAAVCWGCMGNTWSPEHRGVLTWDRMETGGNVEQRPGVNWGGKMAHFLLMGIAPRKCKKWGLHPGGRKEVGGGWRKWSYKVVPSGVEESGCCGKCTGIKAQFRPTGPLRSCIWIRQGGLASLFSDPFRDQAVLAGSPEPEPSEGTRDTALKVREC